jgi:flagellar hook-length control protein FliK
LAGKASTPSDQATQSEPNLSAPTQQVKIQAEPQALPPLPSVAPAPPPAALVAQAALAEPGPHAKAATKSEGATAASETPEATVPQGVQAVNLVDAPSNAKVAIQAQGKVALGTPLPALEPLGPAEAGKPDAPAQPGPTSTLAASDAPDFKAVAPTLAASAHPMDGSALAALSAPIRPVEPAAAVAPAAPQSAPEAPSAPVLQVEGGIKWMLKGGAQEAQLQLHPDSLGQVTIHLRVEGGEVHARLWITEPGSVQAVQEGRPHLEQALKEQGLQLGSFDLQQGQRPFQEAPSSPASREPATLDSPSARQEAPASPATAILNPHHVELYA